MCAPARAPRRVCVVPSEPELPLLPVPPHPHPPCPPPCPRPGQAAELAGASEAELQEKAKRKGRFRYVEDDYAAGAGALRHAVVCRGCCGACGPVPRCVVSSCRAGRPTVPNHAPPSCLQGQAWQAWHLLRAPSAWGQSEQGGGGGGGGIEIPEQRTQAVQHWWWAQEQGASRAETRRRHAGVPPPCHRPHLSLLPILPRLCHLPLPHRSASLAGLEGGGKPGGSAAPSPTSQAVQVRAAAGQGAEWQLRLFSSTCRCPPTMGARGARAAGTAAALQSIRRSADSASQLARVRAPMPLPTMPMPAFRAPLGGAAAGAAGAPQGDDGEHDAAAGGHARDGEREQAPLDGGVGRCAHSPGRRTEHQQMQRPRAARRSSPTRLPHCLLRPACVPGPSACSPTAPAPAPAGGGGERRGAGQAGGPQRLSGGAAPPAPTARRNGPPACRGVCVCVCVCGGGGGVWCGGGGGGRGTGTGAAAGPGTCTALHRRLARGGRQ